MLYHILQYFLKPHQVIVCFEFEPCVVEGELYCFIGAEQVGCGEEVGEVVRPAREWRK